MESARCYPENPAVGDTEERAHEGGPPHNQVARQDCTNSGNRARSPRIGI